MNEKQTSEKLFSKYLKILGVEAKPPSRDALFELVRAQITRVPFENISKLYYLKKLGLMNIPNLEVYLNGIENHHFGGTCYSNSYHFTKQFSESHLGANQFSIQFYLANILKVRRTGLMKIFPAN